MTKQWAKCREIANRTEYLMKADKFFKITAEKGNKHWKKEIFPKKENAEIREWGLGEMNTLNKYGNP